MAITEIGKELLAKANKQRIGLDGLLNKQEALNLGSLFDVPATPEGSSGLERFGLPVRILNIEGEDADSDSILITMQQETIVLAPSSIPPPGPIIGIVEFGTGSGFAKIEFDIPSPTGGPTSPFNTPGAPFISQKSNVVTLVLPASSIRVFARNDAQVGYLYNFNGTPINTSLVSRSTPGQVRVHAAYGRTNMIREKVYREYYLVGGGTTLPPNDSITVGIPPFAKKVSFPRNPMENQPLDVAFQDLYTASAYFMQIAPGDFGEINIPPHTVAMLIRNPVTNLFAFNAITALFELGF